MKTRLRQAFTGFERCIEQLATVIMGLGALAFVSALGFMPFEPASATLIGAVAVTGALSGLCFNLATPDLPESDRQAARYAAEKLLHGSIMGVQAIVVKFAGAQLLKSHLVASTPWLRFANTFIAGIVAGAVGAYAMYACVYGVDRINNVLWRRFRERRNKTLGWFSETHCQPEPAPSTTAE